MDAARVHKVPKQRDKQLTAGGRLLVENSETAGGTTLIGSPSKGIMTHSQKLASFIEHHSFISCFEPTKVEEALQDPDWIMPCMKS